ncbi:MAG: alpha-amylase family glycosyl hydrolase [Eubacteriales bacterium]|nr:alpha-amylase family glycosyl hydrolase [Eubacteriales bacterium]
MERVQRKWDIDDRHVRHCRPGAVREAQGIRFSVAVPQGQEAALLLYRSGSSRVEAEIPFPAKPVMGDIYSMCVKKLPWRGYEYNYRIGTEIVTDPYAHRVVGKERSEKEDSVVDQHFMRAGFAFQNFDWGEDTAPEIPWEEAVMYHLHVRNFTMQKKSGVRYKGTFRGLQERLPYLKELGINQIKLMPVCEFNEYDTHSPKRTLGTEDIQRNFWGYGPAYYFAPKSAYAAGKDAVREFKTMVHAFHEQGIEVLLDFYFTQEMPLTMILECLSWWVEEYHIDGFHIFGREDAAQVLSRSPMFASTKLICSYYPENCCGWSDAKGQKRNCAESNDGFLSDMRRILKGDEGMLEAMAMRTRRNPEKYGVINYITNHDGFTLQDLVSYDHKHNEKNGEQNRDGCEFNFSWNCGVEGVSRKRSVQTLRLRQKKNAILLLMLSQGTPMLMSGDEFGNSQEGNNNPYCQDNEISWVNWGMLKRQEGFYEFVKRSIAFRRAYGVLHLPAELRCMDYRALGSPDLSYHSSKAWYGGFEYNSRQIGMLYNEKYIGKDEVLYVLYNFHPLEQELALPTLEEDMHWYLLIDTSREESFPKETECYVPDMTKSCMIPPRTILVLVGRKEKK